MKFYNATNRVDAAIGRQQGRIDALVADGVDLATKVIVTLAVKEMLERTGIPAR
jgi:hypothetical protein